MKAIVDRLERLQKLNCSDTPQVLPASKNYNPTESSTSLALTSSLNLTSKSSTDSAINTPTKGKTVSALAEVSPTSKNASTSASANEILAKPDGVVLNAYSALIKSSGPSSMKFEKLVIEDWGVKDYEHGRKFTIDQNLNTWMYSTYWVQDASERHAIVQVSIGEICRGKGDNGLLLVLFHCDGSRSYDDEARIQEFWEDVWKCTVKALGDKEFLVLVTGALLGLGINSRLPYDRHDQVFDEKSQEMYFRFSKESARIVWVDHKEGRLLQKELGH